MGEFAKNTSVSAASSRAEIEKTLDRYGASGFSYGWADGSGGKRIAKVAFAIADRHVCFELEMPDPRDHRFTHTEKRGTQRTDAQASKAWEQATRQRWRALNLVIKAKLEAIDSGISTIEKEFLAHIMLPDGKTVGNWIAPQLEAAYQSGEMPKLLEA